MFVSHAAVQKVILHVVGCDWCMVFDPYFFAAEKPLPMMRTCTIVNFHNLHSLLGQFGSFILNKQNQVTTSCVVLVSGKKLYYVVFFPERYKRKSDSCRRKGQVVASYQVMTDPCSGSSVIFRGFMSHVTGCETINIPEIVSGVHSFMGISWDFYEPAVGSDKM